MAGKRARRWVRYRAATSALAAIERCPRPAIHRALGAMAPLAHAAMPKQRRLVRRQIDIAFPDTDAAWRDALERRAFRAMASAAAETCRLAVDPVDTWLSRTTFVDASRLDAARARGRGVVLASAHMGAWEILPSLVAMLGHPVTLVVRSVRERRLDQVVRRMRRAHGVDLVDVEDSVFCLRRALRDNRVVIVAVDQRPRRVRRVRGTFLGAPAWLSTGAATLSSTFRAPVLPAYVRWTGPATEPRMHEVRVGRPQESPRRDTDAIGGLTAALSREVERWIRADPEQWVWFHERWKGAPSVAADRAGDPPRVR